jgi:hypothetical protein
MKFSHHVVSSTLLGAGVYAGTGSEIMAASTVVSGILIDLDHVFDFLVFSKTKFSIRNLFVWCDQCLWDRVTLLFHSWELLLILSIAALSTQNPVLLGIMVGAGFHLASDQVVNPRKNPLHRYFYFLSFRIAKGFSREHILVDSYAPLEKPTRHASN